MRRRFDIQEAETLELPAAAPTAPPPELEDAVRQAVSDALDVLGELGRGTDGTVAYLARDRAVSALRVLRAHPEDSAFILTEYDALDDSIPAVRTICPMCVAPVDGWGRYCPRCGGDVTGVAPADESPAAREALIEEARRLAEGRYRILGALPQGGGGGLAYFAVDALTSRLVTLRLRQRDAVDPTTRALALTHVLHPLAPLAGAPVADASSGSRDAVAFAPQPAARRASPPAVLAPGGAPQAAYRASLPGPGARSGTGRAAMAGAATVAVLVLAMAWHARARAIDDGDVLPLAPGIVQGGALGPADSSTTPSVGTPAVRRSAPAAVVANPPHEAPRRAPPDESPATRPAPAAEPTASVDGHGTASSAVSAAARREVRPRARVAARPAAAPPPDAKREARAPATAPVARASAPSCDGAFASQRWDDARMLCASEAAGGSAVARWRLARLYLDGLGGPADSALATGWLRDAAEAGVPAAQYRLGEMYERGGDVPRAEATAIGWYRRAAMLGDPDAQARLGRAYETGETVTRDLGEAAAWFRKAAAQGNAWAQNHLGWLHAQGRGVPRDDSAAVRLFRAAAEQGNVDAEFNLGVMLADGRGVARDEGAAAQWLRRAAAQGSQVARRELARRGLAR